MLHMAKRPFALVTLLLESHYNEDSDHPLLSNSACIPQAQVIPSSTSPLRRKQITRIKNPLPTGILFVLLPLDNLKKIKSHFKENIAKFS